MNEKLTTLLPHFNDKKMTRSGCSASLSFIQGKGGFISYFILSKIAAHG